MEPIILSVIGLSFLIWRNRIADAISDANKSSYKKIFGSRFDNYEQFSRKINRWGITFGGVLLLIIAYTLWFGPLGT